MANALSKIKQPTPNLGDKTTEINGKKYKITPAANVGVIEVPKMSKTPLTDWIELKKEENPHTIYKIFNKEYKIEGFNTTVAIGIIICGILSIFKLFKK